MSLLLLFKNAISNLQPLTQTVQKYYYYKIYNTSLQYVTTWASDVVSEPTYRIVVNGGAGQLMIRLARAYDNFGESSDVSLNNRVELWVSDNDNLVNNSAPNSMWDSAIWDVDLWDGSTKSFIKLFSGYISAYAPVIDGVQEYVDVTVLGFITDATNYLLMDNSGNTTITYTNQDPGTILQDIITKYRKLGGINLNYQGSSIQTVGQTVTYTFQNLTIKDAMDKLLTLCPAGWYYFVDTNGIVYLQQASTASANHSLTIGKDVTYSQTTKRTEQIVNQVAVVGGGTPNLFNIYKRSGSIAAYGLHHQTIQDGNVTDNTTSDLIAKRQLDLFQLPETRTVIRIIDNNGEDSNIGANIENFQVGDTIQIKNIAYNSQTSSLWDSAIWDSTVWDYTLNSTTANILTIVSLTYYPQYLEIEASSRLPEITKDLQTVDRIARQTANANLPTKPTSRTV